MLSNPRIAELALWGFVMLKCFRRIVTIAINCYNLLVREILRHSKVMSS